MRFTVLASGSSGNASLLESEGQGVLIDAGLGPRQLQARLEAAARSWRHIRAVVLTHVHCDHCNERTLAWLHERRIRLFCHREHGRVLARTREAFHKLHADGLIYEYETSVPFAPIPGLRAVPVPLRHDEFTCGFRFEGPEDLFGSCAALGYICDLGSWDDGLVHNLRDVDVLALEFNHDVQLQQNSGRPRSLIRRVLGAHGHLSNEQASELLCAVIRRSQPGRLRHVVQLHLSRDCNRRNLALAAARQAVAATHPIRIHASRSDRVGPRLVCV